MKKCIILTIKIILIFLICITNVSFAKKGGETWEDFYQRYISTDEESLKKEDLQRMFDGPTEYERMNEDTLHMDSASISGLQERAGQLLDSIQQAENLNPAEPGVDSSITGVDENKAEKLQKEILNFITGKDYNSSKMTAEQLKEWINKIDNYIIVAGGPNSMQSESQKLIMATREEMNGELKKLTGEQDNSAYENQSEEDETEEYIIYNNPEQNDNNRETGKNIDDVIDAAEDFMNMDTGSTPMQTDDLSDFSKTLSGILMTIAIVVSVIMAGILGIKFMIGGIDEKAEVKQMIIPYIVGCIVVFGAFAIWNLVVLMLNNI